MVFSWKPKNAPSRSASANRATCGAAPPSWFDPSCGCPPQQAVRSGVLDCLPVRFGAAMGPGRWPTASVPPHRWGGRRAAQSHRPSPGSVARSQTNRPDFESNAQTLYHLPLSVSPPNRNMPSRPSPSIRRTKSEPSTGGGHAVAHGDRLQHGAVALAQHLDFVVHVSGRDHPELNFRRGGGLRRRPGGRGCGGGLVRRLGFRRLRSAALSVPLAFPSVGGFPPPRASRSSLAWASALVRVQMLVLSSHLGRA